MTLPTRRHDPPRRGRRADAHLPGRQPDRRRLRAARRRQRRATALRLLETKFPDLALVDLGLPDALGLEIVEQVRATDGVASRIDPAVPLLVLSGRAGELDRLRGFERGCDDYVCKPFSYPELRARVAGAAAPRRRCAGGPGGCASASSRSTRRRAWSGCAARRSSCRRRSSRSCARWRAEPTRVFTKDELLRTIWGFRTLGSTRTLDSHACRLRHKLGARRRPLRGQRVGRGLPARRRARRRSSAEPAPAAAPAAAVARARADRRPPDAALLGALGWRRSAVARWRWRSRGCAAPPARARRARLPRAARPADRGAPGAARRRAPRRGAARAPGGGRAASSPGRGRARRPRRRAPRAPRARPRRARRRRRPARLPGADLADGGGRSSAAGSSSSSRARARSCAATACA